MPIDYADYTPDWKEVSRYIREERANNCCEQCGVANGLLILRSVEDGARYLVFDEETYYYTKPDGEPVKASEMGDEFAAQETHTRVVLTVHHVNRNRLDNSDENLLALCQRCHLLADMDVHVAKRKATYRKRRLERRDQQAQDAGQGKLDL